MKVLFVYPNIKQVVQYNHGIASLSASLKETGHETALFIINEDYYLLLKNRISIYQPDMICFSIVSNYWEYSSYLAKKIKEDFNVKIFAGGMHCSIFPQSYTLDKAFDGICLGEGEEAISELVNRIEHKESYYNIKNFWFKCDNTIIKNEIRPPIENLDILPFPDRSIFQNQVNGEARFIFSRGCPFNCSYCSNKAYRDLYAGKGKVIRYRSAKKAIDEIKNCILLINTKTITFDDDSFNKDMIWFAEFVKLYEANSSLPSFCCNTRPELITESSIKLFKKANCSQINIGIESGDQDMRKNVLNRNMSNEQIVSAFQLARQYRISTYSFNMIGFPGETIDNFKKTIRLNQLVQPDKMQISIFYPYPGTRLETISREKGLIGEKEVYSYFYQSRLKLPGFSNSRILFYKILFQFNVYKTSSIMKAMYYLSLDIREYLESKGREWKIAFNILLIPLRFIKKYLIKKA